MFLFFPFNSAAACVLPIPNEGCELTGQFVTLVFITGSTVVPNVKISGSVAMRRTLFSHGLFHEDLSPGAESQLLKPSCHIPIGASGLVYTRQTFWYNPRGDLKQILLYPYNPFLETHSGIREPYCSSVCVAWEGV